MGTKKDIAQALKEQLENLSASPDKMVWEQLETELKAKKKHRSFWYILSLLGIFFFSVLMLNRDSIAIFLNIKSVKAENNYNLEVSGKSPSINEECDTIENSTTEYIQNTYITIDSIASYNYYIYNIDREIIKNNHADVKEAKDSRERDHQYPNFKNSPSESGKKSNRENKITNSSDVNAPANVQTNEESMRPDDNLVPLKGNNSKEENFELSTRQELVKTAQDSINDLIEDVALKDISQKKIKEKTVDSLKTSSSKWSIYPNASLVYYDGFNTTFTNQTTFNYGIYLTYLPSNDFSLRIGLNSLKLSQSSVPEANSELQQDVNYYEIPLELKFALIKGNIRTSLISGMSYLILQDAQSVTEQDGNITSLTNTSDFVDSIVSLNIGLQFQTKIVNQFYFNVEPMFKYHLKPYKFNQVFSPFIISLTSGLEYKF